MGIEKMVIEWKSSGYRVVIEWVSSGYRMVLGWFSNGSKTVRGVGLERYELVRNGLALLRAADIKCGNRCLVNDQL